MKYRVMSRYVAEDKEPVVVEETLRTDKKAAYEDAALIREVFHRAAWVEETE